MLDHTHHFKIFSPFLLLDLMKFTTWTRGLFHPMTIQYCGHYSSFVLVQKTTILNMYLGTMIGKIQRSRGVATSCHSTTFTSVSKVRPRETGERWPLLNVKTKVSGDSGSTYERGPSLVGSLSLSCRYKRFLSCLDCPSQLSSKYFHRTLFLIRLSPLPSKLGTGQAAVLGSPIS
jgi:hypothetical protein